MGPQDESLKQPSPSTTPSFHGHMGGVNSPPDEEGTTLIDIERGRASEGAGSEAGELLSSSGRLLSERRRGFCVRPLASWIKDQTAICPGSLAC